MKRYKFIFLVLIVGFFYNASCEKQPYIEGKRFIIQNESDEEIIVESHAILFDVKNLCRENLTKFEYYDLIRDCMVSPHSYKNIEKKRIAEYMMEHPNDTVYITAFYRIDMDKKPCVEKPVKKEWKVTLSDMQACDWTLVYTE